MKTSLIQLTENEFDDQFPLVTNHLNPNASWAFGEGNGCLFETYGDELAFVHAQNPCTIWTLLDGDDGNTYVASGYHVVNRVGYLISTTPFPDDTDIEVLIPFESDEEGELP